MNVGSEGILEREGDLFIVRAPAHVSVLDHDGVECEDSSVPENERIYRKVFRKKRIFTPERSAELREHLRRGSGVVILGMTGYSTITDENCAAWGIRPGAYELACMDLLRSAVYSLRQEFPGVIVRLSHGASNLGVDRAVITAAEREQIEHCGFSCPKFLLYVPDDDGIVFVSPTQAEYAEAFVSNLDILLSVGGRMQALEHDMLAAIRFNKRLVLLNVLKAISSTGGPPARDGSGKIIDATAAFEQAILLNVSDRTRSTDAYEDLRSYLAESVRHLGRKILPPEQAYSRWTR